MPGTSKSQSKGSRRQPGELVPLSEGYVSAEVAGQTLDSWVSVDGRQCSEEQEPAMNKILYVFHTQMGQVPEEFKDDLTKQQFIFSVLGIMVPQLEEKDYSEKLIQAGLQNVMHHHILSLLEKAYIKGTKPNSRILNVKTKAILNAAPRDLRARPIFIQDLERLAGPECPEEIHRCLRQWKNPIADSSLACSAVEKDEECCVVCLDKPPDPKIVCEQCKQTAMCKPCSRLLAKVCGANKECPLCRHPARRGNK